MSNAAFAGFEAEVILAYNRRVLTQDLLTELMEPHRGTHMDFDPTPGALSADGLDVEEIVIKTFNVILHRSRSFHMLESLWTLSDHVEALQYKCLRDQLFKDITVAHGWS